MAEPLYPYRKFRFKVQMGNIQVASFSEVSGFDASIDVVEYRDGDAATMTAVKMPGLVKYGNITLKRGVIDDASMFTWISNAITGQNKKEEALTITLMDEAGQDKMSWKIIKAWPVKYTAPDFNSTASEVAIETLEIAHEGMTREGGAAGGGE